MVKEKAIYSLVRTQKYKAKANKFRKKNSAATI